MIWRCHGSKLGAGEFNPGLGRGRFHPFVDGEGVPVPTMDIEVDSVPLDHGPGWQSVLEAAEEADITVVL